MLVSDFGLADIHEVCIPRDNWFSLELQVFPLMGLLFLLVMVNSFDECFSAATLLQVLNAYVNTLANNAVADDLVDSDTNSSDAYVEDSACLTMVALVGHSHGLSGISLDVHVVAAVEGRKVPGDSDSAVTSESLREKIPCLTTQSVAVRHFYPHNWTKLNLQSAS